MSAFLEHAITLNPSGLYGRYGAYVDDAVAVIDHSQAGSPLYFYHSNHLFSVAAITDATGAVVERYGYDAYGSAETVVDDPGFDQPYRFTGRWLDDETGLMYFRARYFDSKMGRFTGRDPKGYVDGTLLYAAYFSPNRADPFGEKAISFKMAAFIPMSKGKDLVGNPMPSVRWGLEPSGSQPLGQLGYPKMFSTDDRELAGDPGTSRLFTDGSISKDKIGALEGGKYTITDTGESHQLRMAWKYDSTGNLVEGYKSGSLQRKKAPAVSTETVEDIAPRAPGAVAISRITVESSGAYPFSDIAPNINYKVSWTFMRTCDDRYFVKTEGSHNEFPAYENIAGGKLLYSDYPTASGPGAFGQNLGIFYDNFKVDWNEL